MNKVHWEFNNQEFIKIPYIVYLSKVKLHLINILGI